MDVTEFVQALKEVPEVRLKILDFARESVKTDGSLDSEMLAFRGVELKEAIAQAEEYARETAEALRCLRATGLS